MLEFVQNFTEEDKSTWGEFNADEDTMEARCSGGSGTFINICMQL